MTMTPREMEAREMDRYAGMTGAKRNDAIEYFIGLICGRYGTTTQSGRDYARRVLDAMGSDKP